MAGISAITWCNDRDAYLNTLLPSIAAPFQMGYHDLQPVLVPPDAGARNIGHAYNKALALADRPIKLFVHQDVKVHDRHFLDKLTELLSDPKVGAVGIVGSVVDTGGGFFHTVPANKRGIRYASFYPERCKVKLVDGFLLATKEDLHFSEDYEGPHMAIEDFCMQVRQSGKQVWTLDAMVDHKSGGTLDPAYWRSVSKFRHKWRHMLPKDMLPVTALRDRAEAHAETISFDLRIEVVEPEDGEGAAA